LIGISNQSYWDEELEELCELCALEELCELCALEELCELCALEELCELCALEELDELEELDDPPPAFPIRAGSSMLYRVFTLVNFIDLTF